MENSAKERKEFEQRLAAYKAAIDADLAVYIAGVRKNTYRAFGEQAGQVDDVFLDVLGRGGKRLRGTLVMTAYEMLGGTDRQMVVRAASAMEMLHTYVLIVDDIQDRSPLRRGKPSAHRMLAKLSARQSSMAGREHIGVSLALNAAIAGAHAAQIILANLNVAEDVRIKVVSIVNQALLTTAHGQAYDILQQQAGEATEAGIEQILEWKTAFYTFLNPLCVGMVLAGAVCADTDAIRDYALSAGKAFQISDDILSVFGAEAMTGKSPLDDIREGKQTVLTQYALVHAGPDDLRVLRAALGNRRLTRAQFAACRQILERTGARDHALAQLSHYAEQALGALDRHVARWDADGVEFLRQLVLMLERRIG